MKKSLVIFWINFLFIANYTFAQKDFVADTLLVVWGKNNYQGKKDVSAKVKIYSTGEKIIVEAEVIDDKIINNPDALHSDHIEIWYALPWNDEKSKITLKENLQYTFEPPQYYYRFDSTNKEDKRWKFYSSTSGFTYPYDSLLKSYVFYGQVHYGVFTDNRKVHMFDKENYSMLEKAIGEKIGHVDQGITYKSELTKTGYKTIITITPLALGFIKLPSMNELKMMVDVIDVDSENQETILSSSSNRKWGVYSTFNDFALSKPLKTNVTTVPQFIYDSLHYNPTVMFNEKGYWSGISRDMACVKGTECHLQETIFLRTPFGYKKFKLGATEVEKFMRTRDEFSKEDTATLTGGTEEVYFINKKKFSSFRKLHFEEWNFKGLKKEFVFHDGAAGLLLFKHEEGLSDSCSKVVSKKMIVVRFLGKESDEIFKINQDDCKQTTQIGNQNVANYKIEKIFWIKEGSVLMIEGRIPEKGSKKYKVSFGPGKKVSVAEVKR